MSASIDDDPWLGSAPRAPAVRVPKAFVWSLLGCGCLVVLVFGGLLALGVAMESGHVADSAAVPGHELKSRTVRRLRGENLLQADEEVLYFYSGALLDPCESGTFFTDRRIVDYDTVEGALVIVDADFEEVASIEFTRSDAWLDDSTFVVRCDDGLEIRFEVANEENGAEEFHELLRETWQHRRSVAGLPQDGLVITRDDAPPEVMDFLRARGLLREGVELIALLGVPDAPLTDWGILCTADELAIYSYAEGREAEPWRLEHRQVTDVRRAAHPDPAWVRFEVRIGPDVKHDVDFIGLEEQVARFEVLWREAWTAARGR